MRANQVQVWPATVERVDFWYCKIIIKLEFWIVKIRGSGYEYFVLEYLKFNASPLPVSPARHFLL